jgi:hypothetical protein
MKKITKKDDELTKIVKQLLIHCIFNDADSVKVESIVNPIAGYFFKVRLFFELCRIDENDVEEAVHEIQNPEKNHNNSQEEQDE